VKAIWGRGGRPFFYARSAPWLSKWLHVGSGLLEDECRQVADGAPLGEGELDELLVCGVRKRDADALGLA